MNNVAWLAAVALLESLQLIILVATIGSFIPIPIDFNYYNTLFPFDRKGLVFKRDLMYYRIFVVAAIAIQALLLILYKKSLDRQAIPKLRAWLAMAVSLLIPQFYFIYQFWLGPHPQQARGALCVVCALAVAARIFWPEVYAAVKKIRTSAFFQRKKVDVPIFPKFLLLITIALTIQAYLAMFALYGLYTHRPIWPSADLWNYAVLATLCLTTGSLVLLFKPTVSKAMGQRSVVEALLSFFLLNALFKLHVYYYQPLLAQRAYVVLLVLAIIVKLLWPWIERFLKTLSGLLLDQNNTPALKVLANAGFLVFIFLFLYVPDMEAAMARVFMGEQFHTMDVGLMNTGWAYHSGCKLNVDINNRYGLGMAVMASKLSDLLGGFTYHHIFTIVMLACIVYFLAAYGLLRWWLKSVPIAMAGILIALKIQPFHDETASFYLTNPTVTVCRYFFDIPFLFFILLFFRTLKKYFLLIAAGLSAVALFYALDTGVYLACAYYAAMILILSFKATREAVYKGSQDNWFAALLFLVPPLGFLGLLRWTQGPAVFTPVYWQNMTDYIHFQLWYGAVHMKETLRCGDPWLFGMAMWMIVIYVFTMLFAGTLVYLRKISHEHFFLVVVCVYGLAVFNYYMNRPCMTNCYTCVMPYILVLCWWVHAWARGISPQARKKFYLAFLGLCFYALWTTHLTLAYPNVFNLSRNPSIDPLVAVKQAKGRLAYFNFLFIEYPEAFKLPANDLGEKDEGWLTEDNFRSDDQLKQYFRKEFDFSEDASLIDSLTSPDEPVPLLGSFEIKILMQANRKPFFYVFPLVDSQPMRMRKFQVTHLWRTTDLDRTIRQLEDRKPPYVFMERLYLAKEIPMAYVYDMPGACAVANYVRQNYEPYKIGKYLVAMKRKGTAVNGR